MSIDWKKTSKLFKSKIPFHIRENSQALLAFLGAYYEWLDQQGYPNYQIANYRENRDIDLAEERFIELFFTEYGKLIPRNILADERLVLKHIKQFYRARGSEQSARFLFRILFDEEIEFYYPGTDMWRPDASIWFVEKSLKTTSLNNYDPFELLYKQVIGDISGARTRIERILGYFDNSGRFIYELFHNKVIGTFQNEEALTLDGDIVAYIINGGITTYDGRWLSEDAHVDNIKKLEDSRYYQEYSYVIRSSIPFKDYEKPVKELIHPAGTILFGELLLNIDFSANIPDIDSSEITIILTIESGDEYIPDINIDVGFGSGSEFEFDITINIDGSSTVTEPIINDLVELSDFFRVANSELLSDYEDYKLSQLKSWTLNDFTDGSGIIAVEPLNHAWKLDLVNGAHLILVDNDGNAANSYNEILATDSDTTATLVFKMPEHQTNPVVNGAIYTTPQGIVTDYIAFWRFEEGFGTVARDKLGTSNGTLINSPSWVDGIREEYALQFATSSSNYVQVASSPLFDFTVTPYSISLWVDLETSQSSFCGIISKGNTTTQDFSIQRNSTTGDGRIYHNTGTYGTHPGLFTTLMGGGETHLVLTYDGSVQNVYLNGSHFSNSVVSPPQFSAITPIRIGASRGETSINGILDDVRIYDKVLSSTEIQTLYNGS